MGNAISLPIPFPKTEPTPTPLFMLVALAPEILLRGSPDVRGCKYERPNAEEDEVMIFTPQILPDYRLYLYVSKLDLAKTRRGRQWKAIVTDIDTGLRFAVRSAPCGLGCHCAARVVWVWEKLP